MDLWQFVDERDRWMLRQEDLEWLRNQGLAEIEKIAKQDDVFRLASFKAYLDKGHSESDAAHHVRLSFPMFYLDPSGRAFRGMDNDEDAYLPFALKRHLGVLKLMKIRTRMNSSFSSMNACVRDLIRNGK